MSNNNDGYLIVVTNASSLYTKKELKEMKKELLTKAEKHADYEEDMYDILESVIEDICDMNSSSLAETYDDYVEDILFDIFPSEFTVFKIWTDERGRLKFCKNGEDKEYSDEYIVDALLNYERNRKKIELIEKIIKQK